MKYSSRVTPAAILLLAALPLSAAATPTIDGRISSGEWDGCYLGTATTSGMAVDVYGLVEDGHVYVAYVADTTTSGWAAAKWLGINSVFEFKTPRGAVFPEKAFSKLDATGIRTGPILAAQSDGSGWASIGTAADNDVEAYYHDVMNLFTNYNVVEFKVPIGLVTYAGQDGRLELSGKYWSYSVSTSVYLDLPAEEDPEPDPIPVEIDVRPGSDVNPINLGSNGAVPVAILTTDEFDAASVEAELTSFAGAMPRWFGLRDVDDDGDDDLLLTFRVDDLNLADGDTEATLTGKAAGLDSLVDIEGSDTVRVFEHVKMESQSKKYGPKANAWKKAKKH